MLLNIAASQFMPQQPDTSDGPDIQFEKMQAFEKMQKETEAASAIAPSGSNSVLSLPNRLTMLQRREESRFKSAYMRMK
jgi:hypothetical protein